MWPAQSIIIVNDLNLAGFILNRSKSKLDAQQIGHWLGFQLDLGKGMFLVPDEKISNLRLSIEAVLPCFRVCVRKLASIIGQIISMGLAIGPVARLHTRACTRSLIDVLE